MREATKMLNVDPGALTRQRVLSTPFTKLESRGGRRELNWYRPFTTSVWPSSAFNTRLSTTDPFHVDPLHGGDESAKLTMYIPLSRDWSSLGLVPSRLPIKSSTTRSLMPLICLAMSKSLSSGLK